MAVHPCPRSEGGGLPAVIRAAATAILTSLVMLGGEVSSAALPPASAAAPPMNPLSGSEWEDMGPGGAPPPPVNFATVYDSAADRVILFGGYDGTTDGTDETWAYDFESNAWSNLGPTVHPNAGWTQRAAYDGAAGRTIMFGGFDGVLGAFTDKTWALDAGNNTWTDLAPSSHPSVRSRQGMTYDAQSDRVILFGGLASDGCSAETWAYDSGANAWTDLAPSIHPDARRSMGLVYASAGDRGITVGGTDRALAVP